MNQLKIAIAAGVASLIGATIPASAPAQPATATAACAPGAAVQFICGQRNVEDLVQVPGTDWIIGSGLAVTNQAGSGGMIMIDRKAHTAVRLPAPQGKARAPFTACSSPPPVANFSAHGMNIRLNGRGKAVLYVVSHGDREAIEVFDVANTRGAPSVTWAGCVMAPAGAQLNSVAALADGRLIASDYSHTVLPGQPPLVAPNTGAVYLWKPGGTFEKLPGTDLPRANGIEVTPDGKYFFVAVTGTSAIMRYELADTTKTPWSKVLPWRTDNVRWGPDGKLLLAGPGADPGCTPTPQARCPMVIGVGALDPATLTVTDVKRGPAEPAFQGLSSALIVGNELWLGSYMSDKVAYATLGR